MVRLQQILRARGIQGVLLPPLAHGRLPPDWDNMDWSGFCVIRFGYSIPRPAFHVVASGQVADGIIGYDRIRGKGYRRIGIVQSRRAHTRFIAGALFRQTRLEEGFGCPVLALAEDESPDDDREQLRAWLEAHQPDAIFTGVAGIRYLLKDVGYRVPRDIGLATFSVLDGQADAGIDQNSLEIGKAAVQMLLSLINHNECGVPGVCRELLVEGKWQDGSTLPEIGP